MLKTMKLKLLIHSIVLFHKDSLSKLNIGTFMSNLCKFEWEKNENV